MIDIGKGVVNENKIIMVQEGDGDTELVIIFENNISMIKYNSRQQRDQWLARIKKYLEAKKIEM